MMRAPVVVLPCSSKAAYLDRYAEPDKGWVDRDESRWPMPFWHMDAAMATLLILQTAVDEGLGACFFGIPPEREERVREAFADPGRVRPGRCAHPRAPRPAAGGRRAPRPDVPDDRSRTSCTAARGGRPTTGSTWAPATRIRRRTRHLERRGRVRTRDPAAGFGVSRPRGVHPVTYRGSPGKGRQDMVVLGLILLIIGLVASIPS